MRQRTNTFHMLSETIIGKTDTHRGSAEIPSIKIARVNIKRWRKKIGRREWQRPTPTTWMPKQKNTTPSRLFSGVQVFWCMKDDFNLFLFFFFRCLSPTSQLAGRNVFREVNEKIKKEGTQTGAFRRSGFFDRENRYTYPEILPQTSLPR